MPFTLLKPIFLISLIAIPLLWIGFRKTSLQETFLQGKVPFRGDEIPPAFAVGSGPL